MSIKIMSKVWEQSSHEGSPLLLLLALADHASDDGVCWPGIPRLAHKTRKTERHTKRLLVKLEESGEVYIAREVGRGNTNMYFITLGFDKEEMVHTLIKRFEFEPNEASEIAQQIIECQIKGDIQDTFSGDEGDEKGDIQGQEKVTPGAEKVTPRDGKGDTAMSPESSSTVIKPSVGNRQKDSDFPKTPAPSPGGDGTGLEQGGDTDEKVPASSVGDNLQRDDSDIGPPRGSAEAMAGGGPDRRGDSDRVDPSGEAEGDRDIAPDMWDLVRRTAAARAEAGGNFANPAPSPGGGADSGKEADDGIVADVGDSVAAASGPNSDVADPHPEIGADFDAGTEKMWEFSRKAETKQAEAGNWADAGEDGVAHAALVALHKAKGGKPPRKGTGTYVKETEAISQALRDRGVTDPRVAIMAAQMFVEEKPKLACPHYKSFVGDYGEYLGRAQAQPAEPDRHARYDTPIVRASVAALEERMASRGPPAKDDKWGQAVKNELQLQMTKATFDTWVKHAGMVCDDGVFVVTTANAFARDWLEDRLATTIKRTAVGVLGRAVEVRFEEAARQFGTEPPEEVE